MLEQPVHPLLTAGALTAHSQVDGKKEGMETILKKKQKYSTANLDLTVQNMICIVLVHTCNSCPSLSKCVHAVVWSLCCTLHMYIHNAIVNAYNVGVLCILPH